MEQGKVGEAGRRCRDYPRIADYAIVGDCHTAALIARDGSIDWACPGRFDAPAVFCRLLDARKGGFFRLGPAGECSVSRQYHGPTNVLETTFTTGEGQVKLTDLMPVRPRPVGGGHDVGTSQRILRLIEGLGGEMEMALEFNPTFDFCRAPTKLTVVPGAGAIAQGGEECLSLACPGLDLEPGGNGGVRARLRVRAGDRVWVALTAAEDAHRAHDELRVADREGQLERTLEYWEHWAARCTYRGSYYPQVLRSALTLKLLTYEPSGAIIAAPTTSLPEAIGGVRNWDYRFAWLRDASRILFALMTIGYQGEAVDFFHWLERTQQHHRNAEPQIVYTIDSGRDLPERVLGDLEGYRCSPPVRIGNAAAEQRQLDIYGEILIAAYLHFRAGNQHRNALPMPRPTWALLENLVEQAARRWREPDRGIWEIRGEPQPFLYSRLMCWAALDRGIQLASEYEVPAPVARWAAVRRTIRTAILTEGFNREIGAFTQAMGGTALDASVLAIPRVGFLSATDPRVLSTVERIRAELTHDGLVYRYKTPDGLPGGEGAFALCSFWLVDALALGGQLDEACELFERVTSYANDVGLLSEEIDAATGELLGNFPQGFTHLGLIRSAVNIAKAAKHGPEVRPETEAERARKARRAAAKGHGRRK